MLHAVLFGGARRETADMECQSREVRELLQPELPEEHLAPVLPPSSKKSRLSSPLYSAPCPSGATICLCSRWRIPRYRGLRAPNIIRMLDIGTSIERGRIDY